MEIGQVCIKIAGRDAGAECVIVDVLDGNFVLIDGNTRRRKCNIKHLEPLALSLSVNKNASHQEVVTAMKEAGLKVVEAKKGERSVKKQKPVAKRKALVKEAKPAKDEKKTKVKVEKMVKK